jgi:hypothetical protein
MNAPKAIKDRTSILRSMITGQPLPKMVSPYVVRRPEDCPAYPSLEDCKVVPGPGPEPEPEPGPKPPPTKARFEVVLGFLGEPGQVPKHQFRTINFQDVVNKDARKEIRDYIESLTDEELMSMGEMGTVESSPRGYRYRIRFNVE